MGSSRKGGALNSLFLTDSSIKLINYHLTKKTNYTIFSNQRKIMPFVDKIKISNEPIRRVQENS